MGRPHRLGQPIAMVGLDRIAPLFALVGIVLLSAAIVATGQHLAQLESITPAVEDIDIDTMDAIDGDASTQGVPDPMTSGGTYQRLEARAPLSELSVPEPQRPKRPAPARLTPLYQPVAHASGSFEAMGYRITLAGTEMVQGDENCSYGGSQWPCGARARAAFRAFLRGRAVTCPVPPVPGAEELSVDCRVGHANVGEWLVENGWVRAAATGPYAALGERAKASRKGIFGPPPR
ncbi:thermonuclease family protein [Mesorhizobium sp. NBSH29]|uniref:thermonuclease family protein n=1 Tax=Mesorhizobium sp. NBSH29 TaxID=2654249 RepID=UPI0018965B05|nr:thermonuclease family protein [Mesorhizobium sp. NBSH29]QPC86722.1 thermonuclease family protein [Mesorhizobium sp. NBSH29]